MHALEFNVQVYSKLCDSIMNVIQVLSKKLKRGFKKVLQDEVGEGESWLENIWFWNYRFIIQMTHSPILHN